MSSDSIIEVIPLGNRPVEVGCVTDKMIDIITEQMSKQKKVLIFYNRRGSASAWVCRDCGYFDKCSNCDIAFSYHTFPRKFLLCHHCNMMEEYKNICPNCHGNNFTTVGVGIEQVANSLDKRIKNQGKIGIISSDNIKKTEQVFQILDSSDVIVATSLASLLIDKRIGAVIFPLFEVNISIPDYRLEEELYTHISYIKKQKIPLYIQTFAPEYPLLQEIVFGNYKSFLQALKEERKNFSYPPFVDFVAIKIHHKEKIQVQNMISGLLERIEKEDLSEIFLAYDKDLWDKYHGEWMKKIILKGRGVSSIVEKIEHLIVRNRNIHLNWQ